VRKAKLIRVLGAVLITFVGIMLIIYLVTPLHSLNILNGGTYDYSPTISQPDPLFIVNRPETFVIEYLENKIKQDGTFPADAPSKVTKLEPIKVSAQVITDWQTVSEVIINIHYLNGSLKHERFSVTSQSSKGRSYGPIDISTEATFGPLTKCFKNPDKYNCSP
jgi:hypothetical protein